METQQQMDAYQMKCDTFSWFDKNFARNNYLMNNIQICACMNYRSLPEPYHFSVGIHLPPKESEILLPSPNIQFICT